MKTNLVTLYLDDNPDPIGVFEAPIRFQFDTRTLPDGDHVLKIVGVDPSGKEGFRTVLFTVRNGPAISIEGLKNHDVVDGVLPLMVNAYGRGDEKRFLVDGSETPRSVPSWFWAAFILFLGWALYYLVTALQPPAA